jgi:beta-glucanase (GH16 family)
MWPSPGVTWSYPYGENCGTEVDFAELLGRSPRGVPQTVQGCTSKGGDVGITKSSPISTSITRWHTYAAAVYSNRVVFYIDGHKSQVTYNSAVPGSVNRSTYSDLNTNFNIGGCPTSWPGCPTTHTTQHLYVDWIRAYIK